MNNEEMKAKVREAFGSDLVAQLEGQIKRIESSIPTTMNHYGDYMGLLSSFGDKKEAMAKILILCGANSQGVTDALRFV